MRTSEVFGISTAVKQASYVDRGKLDSELKTLLDRDTHIALRGESKIGKSWLRQKILENPIVVQCRHKSKLEDLYTSALSELGINLTLQQSSGIAFSGRVAGRSTIGWSLIAGAEAEIEGGLQRELSTTTHPAGKDINDLRFIAAIIRRSGRRLVIEDFHYLSIHERKRSSFDLKALWDYHVYVIIVGVWSQNNMLLSLNPDLSGRIEERSISWQQDDLAAVIQAGSFALNIRFSNGIISKIVKNSYHNVGILQALTLKTLDMMRIMEKPSAILELIDESKCDDAIMAYAEQLEPLYLKFAEDVSQGIRKRNDTTGIYAHAMAVILEASDEELFSGLSVDKIFEVSYARQQRIQKGNLKAILDKIEELQVDSDGRGLVFSYNSTTEKVSVVDKQVLLFRQYKTIKWPWEDLIRQSESAQDRGS